MQWILLSPSRDATNLYNNARGKTPEQLCVIGLSPRRQSDIISHVSYIWSETVFGVRLLRWVRGNIA